jgi:REP element-mobilizing transposase RayT
MSQPRCILPGATVMITRRVLRRTCLLRPDPELSELYRYCLASTAEKHGIEVHAGVLMSTHEHLIVTDRLGRLPLFLRELHRLVALGVKVLRKWEGAVWDHEQTSVVHLRTPQAFVEKVAYIMANPVAAGLVRYAKDWPGLTTSPSELGRTTWRARRPRHYLVQQDRIWPPHLELRLTLPCWLGMSDAQVRDAVARELQELERSARAEVRSKQWSVLGAKRVLQASPYDRARSWEPLRSRNPTFAVGRGQSQAFFEAVAELRAFRQAYREALECWRRGLRDTLFPAGTWKLRWLHGAAVAAIA